MRLAHCQPVTDVVFAERRTERQITLPLVQLAHLEQICAHTEVAAMTASQMSQLRWTISIKACMNPPGNAGRIHFSE